MATSATLFPDVRVCLPIGNAVNSLLVITGQGTFPEHLSFKLCVGDFAPQEKSGPRHPCSRFLHVEAELP